MAGMKEIQTRMKSIQDTMKITNAMYMISSSKLKQARKRLEATEPYFYTLQNTMSRILRHLPEIESIYFEQEKADGTSEGHAKMKSSNGRKVGYIVITADKGMSGAYNHNVLKLAEEHLIGGRESVLFVLGELGRQYFEKKRIPIEEQFHYTVQNPTLGRARRIGETVLEQYQKGRVDEIDIIYTRMVNSMQEETELMKLLPLEKADFKGKIPAGLPVEELAFQPDAGTVMNQIVPNYIIGVIYGALVESYSSEQNARMMAMESATESAKAMLKELEILYNRARQAAITQEITEVISGAKAQKKKKVS